MHADGVFSASAYEAGSCYRHSGSPPREHDANKEATRPLACDRQAVSVATVKNTRKTGEKHTNRLPIRRATVCNAEHRPWTQFNNQKRTDWQRMNKIRDKTYEKHLMLHMYSERNVLLLVFSDSFEASLR